jgi:hypothetical protein
LVKKKIGQIESADPIYNDLRKNLEVGKKYLSEHKIADTKKMAAANLLYQENLDEVAAIRLYLQDLKQDPVANKDEIDKYALQLKKALSHAIVYANEAYFTQGAVHFSVIGQQIGKDIKQKDGLNQVELQLSDEEYLHSFREQVGDTLKVLHEYSQVELWKGAYKAGKYIDRMTKSAAPLIGSSWVKSFNCLSQLGAVAVSMKEEGADSKRQQAELVPILKKLPSNMSAFRSLIVQFGIDIERVHKENKKSKQAVQKKKNSGQPTPEKMETPTADTTNPVGVEMQQIIEKSNQALAALNKEVR